MFTHGDLSFLSCVSGHLVCDRAGSRASHASLSNLHVFKALAAASYALHNRPAVVVGVFGNVFDLAHDKSPRFCPAPFAEHVCIMRHISAQCKHYNNYFLGVYH
jgi:hypothetical protein